ncbi:MAG: aspartyl/asparaginyl beta-hydroxylase domain-containing protein [Oligoflexia bacterium]|nr:aspartyl/asparaginyl beta-hydroxylase domain-containing protein [Oligoflexia bacterium]
MRKKRFDLPVLKKLNLQFDIEKLQQSYEQFIKGKTWDGLGNEYASLCESHTRLPKMFFKDEELKEVKSVCDLNWNNTSYKQLSLTDFDESFKLNMSKKKEDSKWSRRIALRNPKADERWFSKIKEDVPEYFRFVLKTIKNTHRTRFSNLAPKSFIKPHFDYNTDYSIRVHIAIKSNKHCMNGGWDKKGHLHKNHIPADGSVWFVNPGVRHFAINEGDTERVHLIISVDSQRLLNETNFISYDTNKKKEEKGNIL